MVHCMTQLAMRLLLWIIWIYYLIPHEVLAYPISTSNTPDETQQKLWSLKNDVRYILAPAFIIVAMISALLGCLCCRRQQKRAKGFQEFKDGSTAVTETIIERDLELEISRSSLNQLQQFEPLTVECFSSDNKSIGPTTPKPPLSSLPHNDRNNQDNGQDFPTPCHEWFSPALHIPRERLKYFREIGHGWFGKVVEGTQNLNTSDSLIPKTSGVVVRILTEEASTSERAWFLGEALPYLKLNHPNILQLLGVCLETDPYLLLFESCPSGDLKAFLQSNRASCEILTSKNVPIKMAINIAMGLNYMHRNSFSHTDLSARNCLVAPDLSAKLGDYGINVEKYPSEYYVVGDRALPIRWSAPESLVCTDTTIETRAITPEANIWSFAILLWEIGSWGERPYNDFGDDQVIEMILSRKFYDYLSLKALQNPIEHLVNAIKSCWKLEACDRPRLDDVIDILKGRKSDFDERWETFKPNRNQEPMRSMSLKELRESSDSELWCADEIVFSTPQAKFKLGPAEPVKNILMNKTDMTTESGSETEEESWRGRVERGVYTEKVKQKSKSVADLMVLVHIDSDSEAEWSLGPQAGVEKPKKRLSTGSVGDLRTTVLTDEFDEALKKLRNPATDNKKIIKESPEPVVDSEIIVECTSTPKNIILSNDSHNYVDVALWKNALEFELERKISDFDFDAPINFDQLTDIDKCESTLMQDLVVASSAPDTPQSRAEDLSVDNEDFSNSEEVETERQKLPDRDIEEEDRKQLSTPDDERSSDSGFRDKESCEEEENIPCAHSFTGPLSSYGVFHSTPPSALLPISASVEEEQFKVLLELDNILDAEDCGSLDETLNASLSPSKINLQIFDGDLQQFNSPIMKWPESTSDIKPEECYEDEEEAIGIEKELIQSPIIINRNDDIHEDFNPPSDIVTVDKSPANEDVDKPKSQDNDDDDEDSSTMSLRSDNSYVSFNLDEEFVTAIRNELREKLPHVQMSVVESQELSHDNYDDTSALNILEQANKSKTWDEDDEELQDRDSNNIDIAIRYNIYGTPLSPILEERESNVTSESFGDTSIASKLSGLSEDVLVVDVRTNQVVLVEGQSIDQHDDDRDNTSNGDITEDDSIGLESINTMNKFMDVPGKVIGAPMPSPEEESKWQAQFSIPLQLQDDLMSTSFSTAGDWDSQDEDDSSSSGEFVWKRYDDSTLSDKDHVQNNSMFTSDDAVNTVETMKKRTNDEVVDETETMEVDNEEVGDDEEDEEEFTPSAWDANLAPHRSALRSPEKTLKAGDQKKNVWFKKQRYQCVYEYPKETTMTDCQVQQPTTTWEPTSYTDWEEMMEKPKVDVYSVDYDESNDNDEEFFVSSGNRPFQFQVGDGKCVSQFFPGACELSHAQYKDDVDGESVKTIQQNDDNLKVHTQPQQQQQQLGELRHTRNKLKLDLPTNTASNNANESVAILTEDVHVKTDFNFIEPGSVNDNDNDDYNEIPNIENDTKNDKTETSTESSTATTDKDEQSIISVIRSPIESLIESIDKNNVKVMANGDESDNEVSEIETSFNDEEIVKSSQRPLRLVTQESSEINTNTNHNYNDNSGSNNNSNSSNNSGNCNSEISNQVIGIPNDNVKSVEPQKNEQILAVHVKTTSYNQAEVSTDEKVIKPSNIDCVIKSCGDTDDEQFNKSAREPT